MPTKLRIDQLLSFTAPQGFLLNGKIVPSVASNNLTVAIKGIDGNDPSASNPVYCRIGDTVRTITSALSVTKNAGTNWFNSGVAGIATFEVDYFVYLGYNATDGVVIGFARIPYGQIYSDFSTTTTNDKYCAISTITNAVAGDRYEVVGRFGATLSAGAGYTWTVPTYTGINLIQRPIFDTRWLVWNPTITCSGSMTYTKSAYTSGKYMISMKRCQALWRDVPTIGGSVSYGVFLTAPILSLDLPASHNGDTGCAPVSCWNNAASNGGVVQHANYGGLIFIRRYDGGNFPAGGQHFGINANYPIGIVGETF